jgi:RNA polymerase sigma-70 factor (ECF subfamily)
MLIAAHYMQLRRSPYSMQQVDQPASLAAARAGDQDAFRHLTDPYRRELLAHCYRILGSAEDAEDMVQETLLRAWRRLESFEGRASLRRWLYTIATNVSLDALDRQRRRTLPPATHPPADPRDPLPGPARDLLWLEPLPDSLIDLRPTVNPETRYEARESVTLAFLVALQTLPGRQRAVLLLRDVIGWNASEVADILGMTVVAVNSALQRARATMKQYQGSTLPAPIAPANNAQTVALLARYVAAWESADSARLIALLREDAVLTMPPVPAWYRGRAAIRLFLDTFLFRGQAQGRFRLTATQANGCPAFAVYQRGDDSIYRSAALHVLTIAQNQIVQIDDFLAFDDRLFSRFGLPLVG